MTNGLGLSSNLHTYFSAKSRVETLGEREGAYKKEGELLVPILKREKNYLDNVLLSYWNGDNPLVNQLITLLSDARHELSQARDSEVIRSIRNRIQHISSELDKAHSIKTDYSEEYMATETEGVQAAQQEIAQKQTALNQLQANLRKYRRFN